MKKLFKYISILLVSFLLTMVVVVGVNYFNTGIKIDKKTASESRQPGPVITVMNWNIGYAGLGKDSDFVMDGGENLLPPSREIVEVNVKGINNILQTHKDTGNLQTRYADYGGGCSGRNTLGTW